MTPLKTQNRMNKSNKRRLAAALASCVVGLLASCYGGTPLLKINGTLEEPTGTEMPAKVKQALATTTRLHQFEIMDDTTHNVNVFGIGELGGGVSTEGYGVVVMKNATSTLFPDIRNSRQPRAFYDAASNSLWLASCVMEGTGVNVEQLHKMRFGPDDDSTRIVATIEPFQMQQQLISHLNYSVKGDQIAFYANGVKLATATNTVTDMGGLDAEQPIWIGEQISYDLGHGDVRVCVTPGVKFTTGLVLTYDDMPTLSAKVKVADDGSFRLTDFKADDGEREQ